MEKRLGRHLPKAQRPGVQKLPKDFGGVGGPCPQTNQMGGYKGVFGNVSDSPQEKGLQGRKNLKGYRRKKKIGNKRDRRTHARAKTNKETLKDYQASLELGKIKNKQKDRETTRRKCKERLDIQRKGKN